MSTSNLPSILMSATTTSQPPHADSDAPVPRTWLSPSFFTDPKLEKENQDPATGLLVPKINPRCPGRRSALSDVGKNAVNQGLLGKRGMARKHSLTLMMR